MTIAVETYLVVALAFAVFAAVTALGSSLVLGAGFERLRAGFELIKSQTGFFSDAIHKLDKRLDNAEKQDSYFFQAIHKLEENQVAADTSVAAREEPTVEPQLISTDRASGASAQGGASLWAGADDVRQIRFH
ncbi:MAG: hypothetical protein HY370_04610 [Proteobacteria bacterium]|nr:hypothetical protein [Pseudomonadota bacterium]